MAATRKADYCAELFSLYAEKKKTFTLCGLQTTFVVGGFSPSEAFTPRVLRQLLSTGKIVKLSRECGVKPCSSSCQLFVLLVLSFSQRPHTHTCTHLSCTHGAHRHTHSQPWRREYDATLEGGVYTLSILVSTSPLRRATDNIRREQNKSQARKGSQTEGEGRGEKRDSEAQQRSAEQISPLGLSQCSGLGLRYHLSAHHSSTWNLLECFLRRSSSDYRS